MRVADGDAMLAKLVSQVVGLELLVFAQRLISTVERISTGLDDQVQRNAWQRLLGVGADRRNLQLLT